MDYTDLYINGTWHKTAERFDVINPATEQVIASVASADIADADAALDAQAEELAAQWHAAYFDGGQYSGHRDEVGFAMSLFPQGDQPWVDETNWLPPCADPVEADQ